MRTLIRAALERTAGLWPDIAETHRWLHAAAYVLANAAGLPAAKVQGRYDRPTAAGTGPASWRRRSIPS